MTPIFDVLGGLDFREYDEAVAAPGVDDDTPELVVGLRRRIFELWRLHPYLEGNLRYGADVTDFDEYFGWALGGGAMVDLTDRLFVNLRVMYESTPVDAGGTNRDVEALIGTLGVGLSL